MIGGKFTKNRSSDEGRLERLESAICIPQKVCKKVLDAIEWCMYNYQSAHIHCMAAE
jgi:hypothetical protein